MSDVIVWAVDIGSVNKGHFGWCRAASPDSLRNGKSITEFTEGVASDLTHGQRVALGFGCPLTVPVANNPNELTKARDGEGDRSWCAAAGGTALATGLVECVWVFERIRKLTHGNITPVLDWSRFLGGKANLFVWEAVVSGKAKGAASVSDATVAASAFWARYPEIDAANAIQAANPFSLAGAALLRAGLARDVQLLSQPCVALVTAARP
jgi:hypothetical protein